jgi:hypothetical protein
MLLTVAKAVVVEHWAAPCRNCVPLNDPARSERSERDYHNSDSLVSQGVRRFCRLFVNRWLDDGVAPFWLD